MKELFKERVNKSHREDFARELLAALKDPKSLEVVLFGDVKHNPYIVAGQYTPGDHSKIQCIGFTDGPLETQEKRLCKCLYYFNNKKLHNCNLECKFNDRFALDDFRITDYEVPAFYAGAKIGEIDLMIEYQGETYATEVKPYAGNNESLIRMVGEIMTYTYGFEGKLSYRKGDDGKPFNKAIAFFKDSPQAKEYEELLKANPTPALLQLLQAANITVFMFIQPTSGVISVIKDPALQDIRNVNSLPFPRTA